MNFYIWRDNVVESLLGLADIEYQRLAWTGAIPSADGTPDEMLCTLVDDWAFASFAVDNKDHLDLKQVDKAASLMAAIRVYQDGASDFDGDVDRTLRDEAWLSVVEAAKRLYIALCPGDPNENERD